MITSERMAAVDRNAAAVGVPREQLMESSGNAVARAVRETADAGASIAVVAGRGNNGGDAFVAARFLGEYDVTVHLLGRPETITTDISRANWGALQQAEIPTEVVKDASALDIGDPDVVVDAVLGTGVSGAPREPEASAIEAINDADAPAVAVDVPSGMDADTGETPGVAVDADRVVTFHDVKPALVDREDVTVADIGIPEAAELFVGPGDLQQLERDPHAHKGEFGRVLVVGGGPYTGAPALSAQAALRAGADLAYLAVPDSIADTVQGYSENLIVDAYVGTRLLPEHVDEILDRAADVDVVLLGPGLGDADDTLAAVRRFLAAYDGKAVVDADALQVVPDVETDADLVCTPHQGELKKMGGASAEGWRERANALESFAADLGQTVLVKGAYDVVSDGETTRVNRTGNPGMTVGGTGDVLAGATAAMFSTLDGVPAASVGAYANGAAGDHVVDDHGYGLLATDLLDALPAALWGDDDE
ncbi:MULTISPECIES: bifunctional ADP-dependent NAD(P)H-hydrate dehydratase/NAD(P)H-hydrate epimerase [Halobacterium]|uniref:bifunctional ADP-dependent NAD(P)H-hydrate dehydratase/NAD(P)H-hydrate epimerase n=1 Tax=Halobacterium TaxID=2239 RepID=UPI00073F6FF2|nr:MULTISPECIES: bifunctional ADP-dependent NAD(P)H-hydrate dehydratase/NAD(P)H-hydrate epimerase [Halobacterium]MCG1003408.1 bifunctional ADP-dependent NAD(P)H-hydrate dehydratase/NAD(P)H-hydrate epimerase [Halobacterium noricense]